MATTTFQLICKTDLYNASRHAGFDSNTGIKVIGTYRSLKEANAAILALACEAYEREFPNWGLVCAAARHTVSSAGTHSDGCRYFSEDIYNYSVEEVEA